MESVLIVDDEKDNLEALRRLLRHGFNVTTTDSGVEALKLIRAQEFAVIVSDQRMPEITGVDLLEKVKQLCPATTRILLTGYTEVESVIGAINRGNIYRYVAKPWDPEDLKITLKQAAEAYRLRKDLDEKNALLEKSNQELKVALEELRQLDRAKGRFLSLVSHELNTPLTAVTAFISLLGEHQDDFPKDVQRSVVSLSEAASRLAEIVEEVLTYVRLEAEAQWKNTDFDWEKETVKVIQSLDSVREKKQVDIAVQGKPGVVSKCAAEKMRVGISKVIHEAILRSPKGERVTVMFRREADHLLFRVGWKGAMVPASAFQAFETGGEQLHHHRNLALGLATAKLVVERQGGKIASDGTDKNAGIQMTLPLAKG